MVYQQTNVRKEQKAHSKKISPELTELLSMLSALDDRSAEAKPSSK